eukprot:scaffold360_cov192-Amphora_coffeaeformis.AAC.8
MRPCHFVWLILVLLAPNNVTGLAPHHDPSSSSTCTSVSSSSSSSRRRWMASVAAWTLATVCIPIAPSQADVGELPSVLKDYTKLAPLGPTYAPSSSSSSATKTLGLSLEELAQRLGRDLSGGSTGRGSYIISGDLSEDIFRDDCIFQDPTNRVRSLGQYKNALRILFDPDESVVQVLGPLMIDKDQRTISGRYRSRGFLKLPWKPFVSAYEADIVYRIDKDGLVYEQDQKWSKSSTQALQESFTPSLFSPPPKSNLRASMNEPAAVTALFDACNGRRPEEYSAAERKEIADLFHAIQDAHYPWDGRLLPGKWKLVYLEPGPEGAGVDRRIPFPEFPFNDQYQIFTATAGVTNVGELFGPNLFATVEGDLTEVDTMVRTTPKGFRADILGGALCYQRACVPLPIQGVGLFDVLYLGERVRLLQNINGGGAIGIQIKME